MLQVDPAILVTALLATTTVFVCFAGAALFSKRRSYLYLGGVLSSGLMGEFELSSTRSSNGFLLQVFCDGCSMPRAA